ncbi:MAG: transcriptional regulator, partial [Acidobacteriaceae bacterium]
MPRRRNYRNEIDEQLAHRNFRRSFLCQAINKMVAGDFETAKSVLREYIHGTVGFVSLGDALSKSPKSLLRMLGPTGNPQARNLFEILAYLQKIDGTLLEVRPS